MFFLDIRPSSTPPDARDESEAVEFGEKLRHGRTMVRPIGEPDANEPSVRTDDGVRTELACVFVDHAEPTSLAEEAGVHAQRSDRPDVVPLATCCAEEVVQLTLRIGDQGDSCRRELQMVGGGTDALRVVCEADDDRLCLAEPVEVVAHGDHVFLAGQSSEMAVEDQDDGSAEQGVEMPGRSMAVDQLHIW
jgi:hypothetical protein